MKFRLIEQEFLIEHSCSHFSRSLDHRKRLIDSHLNYANLHKLMKLQLNRGCVELSNSLCWQRQGMPGGEEGSRGVGADLDSIWGEILFAFVLNWLIFVIAATVGRGIDSPKVAWDSALLQRLMQTQNDLNRGLQVAWRLKNLKLFLLPPLVSLLNSGVRVVK